MRKNKLLLLLALLMTAATGAWAQSTSSLVFEAACNGSGTANDNVVWTVTSDGSESTFDNTKGIHYGTNKATVGYIELSTSGISGTITQVVVNASTASGVNATVGVTVGGNAFGGNAQSLTTSAEDYTFTGSASGAIVVRVAKPSAAAKALYVKSIEVTYTSSGGSGATYTVSMKDGVKDADKWTASTDGTNFGALPIGGLKGDGSETVTLQYNGRLKVKGVKATSDAPAAPAGNIVDLSTLTADYEAQNGDVLTGVTSSYKVTIAAGATVTLDGVTISRSSYCIKCLGDATIILKDGSTNTLTSTSADYPALSIGDANTTLTIQGNTGVLNVTSGENSAGIGGGYMNADKTCGNIRIEGGVITAQGGQGGSGIGSDCGPATCGDIIITGGTITAKGGRDAAGIGTGSGTINPVVCGDITIANTVTKVTATKGENAPHSIGKGHGDKATCGTIIIGGTKYWENNAALNDGDTYLATSPLEYQPSN